MDEEKRGGESYSYGAVCGSVVLNEMRTGGAEGNKGGEREGGRFLCDLEVKETDG